MLPNSASLTLRDVCHVSCSLYVIGEMFKKLFKFHHVAIAERTSHRPVITMKPPGNQSVRVGENVTFECMVYSTAFFHVEWRYGKKRNVIVLKVCEGGSDYCKVNNACFFDTDCSFLLV